MEALNAFFTEFHFLRPLWLLALIPLLMLIWALKRVHRHQSGWQQVLAGHLYQHLIQGKSQPGSRPPFALLALGWVLATVALAGPTWEKLPQPVYQLHSGKVVVMDLSMSMRATDIAPDRLTRARFKAMDLIDAMPEGDIGLVAYAGDAFTIAPLSNDGQTLTALIPALQPEIMPVPGSEPITGLKQAAELLKNAGYQEGEIFWITDGINMVQSAPVNDLISDLPYRLSILAVGTADGAPIKLTSGELLKDNSGSIVIPKLRESLLKPLAQRSGGRYAPIQADDSDIHYLTSQNLVNRETKADNAKQDQFGDQWREAGPWLALLLLPLAAYAFRRGLVMALPLVLFSSLFTAPQAQANWWDDLWQRPDQQGQQLFNQGDYDSAAKQFSDPLWQGSAHYKNGDYEQALDAFSQSDSAQGWYNRGNALAHMGQLDKAIEAYDKALEKKPDLDDAAANKKALEELKKQQQSQQQQDQNQQNQQNSKSPNNQDQNGQQDKASDQGDPSQQQDSQNQDSQSQQNSTQQQQGEQESQSQSQPSQKKGQNEAESQQQDNDADSDQQARQQQTQGHEQDSETDTSQSMAAQGELTDEQKEQQQRLQKLMRRVPDDPAYLLKRKMQLEYQKRRRQRIPTSEQENW
ncbi:putative serine/threonine-protein kinase irlF [Saliniradius amylolyticus]|uniref:Putative serine/threonine-protein kinase irlF n=1 Tax=Saliniradius amylolyticus TaxID=2183582 RepID=A0A2S2E606_9ALTE|nr:tetratricopeptide repeat protein [Saliniradius amylolyticus]AWL12397.1 putative serine/threonine-protein kinase irlF [Saliniradius amylolyticus]